MKDTISDIRQKIANLAYKNEEHVRLSLVARVLQKLGWNIWDPCEVNSEYNATPHEDSTRVDIALFSTPRRPDVFIEIKAVGKISSDSLQRAELQLRDYNRDNTASFSIITDGQIWRFYLSQSGGKFSDKCFKVVDLLNDDLDGIEVSLCTFLKKSEIENGNAIQEAHKYLRLTEKQRVMEGLLPQARRVILEPPYPSLPEALIELVAKGGFTINVEEAQDFIKATANRPSLPPPITNATNSRTKHIFSNDQRIEITLKTLHTAPKYALIPIPRDRRSFFPGYKIPFILETDVGEITTQVTSAPKGAKNGDPEAGTSIQGGLKPWYDAHRELKEGNKLILEAIESNKRYRLSISG